MAETTQASNPEDSILTTIKKLLGISSEDTSFDQDIIISINSAFASLNQIGVKHASTKDTDDGYSISDATAKWSDFTTDKKLNFIQQYIYLKVRLVFDPPTNSSLIQSINNSIKELEYRLYTQTGGY